MIERESYRQAASALRRLRHVHAGPRRAEDASARALAARSTHAEEVEAYALDYLYGRRSTSVELIVAAARPSRAGAQGRARRGRGERRV
jgi:hypothetical protein